jgi:hypothetical protein
MFKPGGDVMSDLDRTVLERHSTRMFFAPAGAAGVGG